MLFWFLERPAYICCSPKLLKKVLSIISFCLLGLGTWGVFPVFQLLRLRAQHMAEDAMEMLKDNGEFAIFENLTDNPGVQWEDGQREFWLQGKMYDVGRVITAGTTTFYYCYADEEDTNLTTGLGGGVKPVNEGIYRLMILLARPFVTTTGISIMHCSVTHVLTLPCARSDEANVARGAPEIPEPPPWHRVFVRNIFKYIIVK